MSIFFVLLIWVKLDLTEILESTFSLSMLCLDPSTLIPAFNDPWCCFFCDLACIVCWGEPFFKFAVSSELISFS